ncbi:MAG: protease SohB [Candidatus Berkiellales bacterium]
MSQFFLNYGLFLAKILTLIFGLLILLGGLIAIVRRGKLEDGTLQLTPLNEKYEQLRFDLQAQTLPKPRWKKWLKSQKEDHKLKKKLSTKGEAVVPRLFVVRFEGDIRASHVKGLREIISAIIEIATPQDEVLIVLESSGGFVHSYGLAASQLDRLRQRQIFFTVAIDKCAASGGYLMACVANRILAAPFAIVGSIGVVAQLPNFNRLLNKHNIDFELITAGEYKRTLTIFGKNTEKGREKLQSEVEETHTLFKEHIIRHRPQVVLSQIATGEHWHAIDALKLNLIDELQTSDDFILTKIKTAEVFEISYHEKEKLSERIASGIVSAGEKVWCRLLKPFSL